MDQQSNNISADQTAETGGTEKVSQPPALEGHGGSPADAAVERIAAAARALDDSELAAKDAGASVEKRKMAPTALIPLPEVAAKAAEEKLSGRMRVPSHLPLYTAVLCLALGIGGVLGGRLAQTNDAKETVAEAEGEAAKIERALPWKRDVATAQVHANAKVREDLRALRSEMAALRTNNEQLRQAEGPKQTQELRALRAALEAQKSETASLKADLAARMDRVDRDASQRGDKTADRIDRLEKRLVDPTATGTIRPAETAKTAIAKSDAVKIDAAKATATKSDAAKAETAKAETAKADAVKIETARAEAARVEAAKAEAARAENARAERPSLRGMILRDVDRGVALIETRRGMMEVTQGDAIPGAGRVEAIEKHAGRWRVVTTTGIIDDRFD